MRRHLIVGASGQVGEHLLAAVRAAGIEVAGTYHQYPCAGMEALDISDARRVRDIVKELQPAVIYLPGCLSNVDVCEAEPDRAYKINVSGVANIAAAANDGGAKLVYYSSDYVFDGQAGPYREEDPPRPICEYGRQKVWAEQIVATQSRDWIIIRTTVVYGWERRGKNFVCRLVKTLGEGRQLRVPEDQIGNPTYARDLADSTLRLVAAGANGVYHAVGAERVSRYEFAQAAAHAFGLSSDLIIPVSTAELGQTAPRPLNAGMYTDKLERELGCGLPGFREGLARMAAERHFVHAS